MEPLRDFLDAEPETERTRKNMRELLAFVSLIMFVVSVIMSFINVWNQSWVMLTTTALLAAVCLLCLLICLFRYNRPVVEGVISLTIISLFSFYTIIGGNAGFAIDWILLVPIAYMALFGLTGGLLMGGYFWVFLVVCLWAPVNGLLPYAYTDEVRLRFPILYTCGFLLAILFGVRNRELQLAQMRYEEKLSNAVVMERNRVERVSMDAIASICHALDAKDPYTREHSDHVAAYSSRIAQRCGWDARRVELLMRAARMHDLGKIGIPDGILKKQGPLTHAEREVMRGHVALGAEIVAEFESMPELAVGAQYHHERYGGGGYSTGAAGEDIPIEGRIIGLADAIDAMTSDRVYRARRSRQFLLDELRDGAGKQFDPKLVRVALELIAEGMIEQVSAPEKNPR